MLITNLTTTTTHRPKHKLHYQITDSVLQTSTIAKKYDRLSVLIEHGLFETLKKKFKLFNEIQNTLKTFS